MGALYHQMGQLDVAIALHEDALKSRRLVLGEDHRRTADSLWVLARLYIKKAEISKAEPMFQQALSTGENIMEITANNSSTYKRSIMPLLVNEIKRFVS